MTIFYIVQHAVFGHGVINIKKKCLYIRLTISRLKIANLVSNVESVGLDDVRLLCLGCDGCIWLCCWLISMPLRLFGNGGSPGSDLLMLEANKRFFFWNLIRRINIGLFSAVYELSISKLWVNISCSLLYTRLKSSKHFKYIFKNVVK